MKKSWCILWARKNGNSEINTTNIQIETTARSTL